MLNDLPLIVMSAIIFVAVIYFIDNKYPRS